MWKYFFLLLAIVIPGNATAADAENVSWHFETKRNDEGNPTTKVYVTISKKDIFLLETNSVFDILDRQKFNERSMPKNTIIACSGWWAGQGQDLYVMRRKNKLIVFIRDLDEGVSIPAYKPLKTIELSKQGSKGS
jgi:hypothetical protein